MKIKHIRKTVKTLHAMSETIHLNPSWQRGAVWSISKKALLIDSMLRGYDIPMIYLRKCSPSGAFRFEVVDGQQRLRAMWDYLEGDFALPAGSENVGITVIGGKKFDELAPGARKNIKEFPIMVAEIRDSGEPEISRLFSRMQMGVRLNPAELRNAIQSGLRNAIDTLARSHPFFQQSRIPANRFKHQDYLSHAFSVCFHGARRDLKAAQLKEDYEVIVDPHDFAAFITGLDDILDFLQRVNNRVGRRITQKWIFVDLCLLLFQNKKNLRRLSAIKFAKKYEEFDKVRRENNAEPEALLLGRATIEQRQMYDYIAAFKISGGEKRNVQTRNRVVKKTFSTLLRS